MINSQSVAKCARCFSRLFSARRSGPSARGGSNTFTGYVSRAVCRTGAQTLARLSRALHTSLLHPPPHLIPSRNNTLNNRDISIQNVITLFNMLPTCSQTDFTDNYRRITHRLITTLFLQSGK